VLIASDGRGFAVRGGDGRLAIHHGGGDSFAIREWLAADGDGRDVKDRSLGQGIACDPSACIGKLGDGELISYVLTPEAYEEDCARAALVVATRGDPPADCRATVISRALWRQSGALTLRRDGNDFIVETARPKNFDRPWSPATLSRNVAATPMESGTAAIGDRAPDATPRQEDIEADQ
jgi:competence protein ComEC